MLGPQIAYFSQNDKARVPIGLTATQRQSLLLMHLEYRVTLPDHDWVVAEKHKLIPSVYVGIVINTCGMGSSKAVTYSGPTYVVIRSGKHSASTAASHSTDFKRLLDIDSFKNMKSEDLVKSVVIISVDGGPDENPR